MKRGYLHMRKEDLQRTLDLSRKGIAMSRIMQAGPYFLQCHKK